MSVVSLPAGWPSGLPLPEGAAPVADESDGDVMRIRFEGGDVDAFFTAVLVRSGWDVSPVDDALEIEGHGFFGQIEIEEDGFSVQLA